MWGVTFEKAVRRKPLKCWRLRFLSGPKTAFAVEFRKQSADLGLANYTAGTMRFSYGCDQLLSGG